jgi:hypothetical protein
MRESGYEQKGLIRFRKERGDAHRLHKHHSLGHHSGYELVRFTCDPVITEKTDEGIIAITHGGTKGIAQKYRRRDKRWQRFDTPVTGYHGLPCWVDIPDWSVPDEVKSALAT